MRYYVFLSLVETIYRELSLIYLEGIIRKAIIWGTAIIIAILYIRKIKDMTQK